MRPGASNEVVYASPYVPPEWVAAHGFEPRRVLLEGSGGSGAAMGRCRFAQAFAEHADASGAAAALFATSCDQMRRASSLVVEDCPTFLLNVPATWQSATARDYYRAELLRLGDFLVDLGGTVPADGRLTETITRYDASRRVLREAGTLAKGSAFAKALTAFHRDGKPPVLDGAVPRGNGVPIAFLGGSLLAGNSAVFELVEANHGEVVLDATTTGERSLPAPIAPQSAKDDPLEALVHAYFDHIPDAFRRPNTRLYEWFTRECADRGVRGIVFIYQSWCDIWRAEIPRMDEILDMPLLALSPAGSEGMDGRITTRIQAFLETLQ